MPRADSLYAESVAARLKRWRDAVRVWLHWLNGDTAYARYREHACRAHPDQPPLSHAEFFRQETERRWHGVRRCC